MKKLTIALVATALLTSAYAAEAPSTAPAEKPSAKEAGKTEAGKPEPKTLSKPAGEKTNESPLVRAANAANAARAKKKTSIVIDEATIKASKNSEANVTTTESRYNPKFIPTLPPPEVRAALEKNKADAARKAVAHEQQRRDKIAALRLELARIQGDLIDESEDPAGNDPERIERRMTEIQKEIQDLEAPVKKQ